MKFKLDENLDNRLAALLQESGYDTTTVLSENIRGTSDDKIFSICRSEDRCLVTLDLDFSNPLRFPPAITEGIIVLRPVRPSLPLIRAILTNVLATLATRSVKGRLWIVEPGRIREFSQDEL